ncbi:MAG: protein translocase subunit SecD [Pseudomonadota bacterium]
MQNRYPLWKYILILALLAFGIIFALPNLYADLPALQVSSTQETVDVDEVLKTKLTTALQAANLMPTSEQLTQNHNLILTFSNTDQQAAAQEVAKSALGDDSPYIVALYLMPTTPKWLTDFGAKPMRLGLDLRGGVHFLLAVDIDAVFERMAGSDVKNMALSLRGQHIRYSGLLPTHIDGAQGVTLQFRNTDDRTQAYKFVTKDYPNYQWTVRDDAGRFVLQGVMGQTQYQEIRQNTLDQSMTILRNRVNELGISEAVVTQQGADQIAIDLPGIQDPAQAQNIIGKTATLEFHLVDTANDAQQAAVTGVVPTGDVLAFNDRHQPFLLKDDIILEGAAISNATANYGDQGAEVGIQLSGSAAVSRFNKVTAENIGKLLATLYVETRPIEHKVDGKTVTTYKTEKRVINAATINSALGNSFRITGMSDIEAASNLALLLRAGALPVPIHIIQERTIGPSLGQQNIDKGLLSVEIGFGIVVLFMTLYYRVFGLIANVALGMNLLLIVAIMSLLGSVLTLPGIAGMVLTVGMAVDANVLIFERIREELRLGTSTQAAIFVGYEKAFITIVDANVTTLIVAIVLFSLGSGAVKGFAITLTIGLITSMITAILGTRALVNGLFGRRVMKQLPLGINVSTVKKSVVHREPANS